jgi:hypothetical protein
VLARDGCGGTTTLGAVSSFVVVDYGARSMNPNRVVTPADLGSILDRDTPPSPACVIADGGGRVGAKARDVQC